MSEEHYGVRRALNELLSIFSCQWQNGLLPQIRFNPDPGTYRPGPADWGVTAEISGGTPVATSGITQPPIMGLAALEVFRRTPDQGAYFNEFLEIVAGLEQYHSWLFAERDPQGENLVVCVHPWETGTDNLPAFDASIDRTREYVAEHDLRLEGFERGDTVHVRAEQRPAAKDYVAYFGLVALFRDLKYDQFKVARDSPFLVQDTLFNSVLAVSLDATARLEEELAALAPQHLNMEAGSRLVGMAAANRGQKAKLVAAMRRKLWSERDGLFYCYDLRGEMLLETPTVSSFLPLLGGVASEEQADRMIEALRDSHSFATPVPIPSTAANDPHFDPLRYWAGPSWPVTNWLVAKGLRDYKPTLAHQINKCTIEMIAEGLEDRAELARRAAQLLELNSFADSYTTPSRAQYQHAWLWDSAIVAIAWPLIDHRPDPEQLRALAEQTESSDANPLFWEYYNPHSGAPLGAKMMTWTAAVALDLLDKNEV